LRTISYQYLLNKFTADRGVDALLASEKTAFSRSLNHRIRQIWFRSKWPDLLVVVEKALQVIDEDTIKVQHGVKIDTAVDLYDVFGVFDRNPYKDSTAVRIDHTLIDGYLVLPKSTKATSVFIVGSKVPHDDYGEGYFSGEGRTDIPAFMEHMLIAYAMGDFYRADGQNDKALVEEQKAEEYNQQALDRFERTESQNQITVNTYPPSRYSNLQITQRNV
jgi:hypothetical protein